MAHAHQGLIGFLKYLTIHTRSRNLFHLNSMFLKLLLLSLFCERAENQHIVICSLRDTGIKRQPQMRIDNQTQQRTPARKPASVSKQWIIGDYRSYADQNRVMLMAQMLNM